MYSMLATSRFLTRLPLAGDASSDRERIHAAWFPLVGLAIGGLIAGVDLALAPLYWPIRNALLVAVGMLITGALHLDALMDSVDGLAVPRAESQHAIRTSVHTAEGVAAGIVAMSVAWLALDQLTDPTRTRWLICAPLLGRAAIVFGYRYFRASPEAGPVTRSLAESAREGPAVAALALAFITCLVMIIGVSPLAIAMPLGLTILVAHAFRWRTGALGGDHYGALAVIGEVSVLMCATLFQTDLQ
jgi:adenosylcobinamide-GDP ribazoletransferase